MTLLRMRHDFDLLCPRSSGDLWPLPPTFTPTEPSRRVAAKPLDHRFGHDGEIDSEASIGPPQTDSAIRFHAIFTRSSMLRRP